MLESIGIGDCKKNITIISTTGQTVHPSVCSYYIDIHSGNSTETIHHNSRYNRSVTINNIDPIVSKVIIHRWVL